MAEAAAAVAAGVAGGRGVSTATCITRAAAAAAVGGNNRTAAPLPWAMVMTTKVRKKQGVWDLKGAKVAMFTSNLSYKAVF